jgi:hypothetical protein
VASPEARGGGRACGWALFHPPTISHWSFLTDIMPPSLPKATDNIIPAASAISEHLSRLRVAGLWYEIFESLNEIELS